MFGVICFGKWSIYPDHLTLINSQKMLYSCYDAKTQYMAAAADPAVAFYHAKNLSRFRIMVNAQGERAAEIVRIDQGLVFKTSEPGFQNLPSGSFPKHNQVLSQIRF